MTVEQPGKESGTARDLLAWYDDHARDLPWRIAPGDGECADPYRVWLSEVMLQQTTVAAAAPYFAAFTARWPDVAALAAADDADVMAAWAGLGYYARARNLLACARIVAGDLGGVFPGDETTLRTLPGIGDYTAAAIAAIAFGRAVAVVDANVERVAARLFAIRAALPLARPAIRAAVARIVPPRRPGDFAQAMMDLGARICTPRDPQCGRCPIAADCAARRDGLVAVLPVKRAKPARPQRFGWAYWVERDGAVLLVTRPASGMLGGMRALPGDDWAANGRQPPVVGRDTGLRVQHVFTHFALELGLARLSPETPCLDGMGGEWWPLETIDEAGLPTLYARASHAMLGRQGRRKPQHEER